MRLILKDFNSTIKKEKQNENCKSYCKSVNKMCKTGDSDFCYGWIPSYCKG